MLVIPKALILGLHPPRGRTLGMGLIQTDFRALTFRLHVL